MAYYVSKGKTPPKRHTQFRQPDGSLYAEELVSSLGFSGIYSNLIQASFLLANEMD
jgi:homogentisate 1,2-dioxygenase